MNIMELKNQRDETMKQLLKLKFVTQTLLDCNPNMMQLPDELESIEDSLRVLRVREYLNLNPNENESLLNLGDYCQKVTLSYTAQKAVQQQLIVNLRNRLIPLTKFIEKMQLDLPYLYEKQKQPESSISGSCAELLDLEKQRREAMLKLWELNNQKVELLRAALDLKLGPQVRNELETLHAETRLTSTKAKLMCSYLINHFVTQSENSLKAIKEVESIIDKRLDEQTEEQKNQKN